MKKIFLITLTLLIFFSCASVYAGDNATNDIISVDETTNLVEAINNNETDVISMDANEILTVEDNNQVIDSVDDESKLGDNPAGTFSDLANDVANANGELILTKNYVYDSAIDSNFTNGIIINKQITINGKGFSISGCTAFQISSENVILKNIKFTNNQHSSNSGGAIYWSGANGNIFDCTFTNSHTSGSGSGGAIYWSGANGNIFDCTFTNCYTYGSGSGGAIYWNGASGNLYDCTFTSCRSSNSDTDRVTKYASSASSSATCTYYGGGAVYWNSNNGNISDCDFISCYSSSGASASAYNGADDLPSYIYSSTSSTTSSSAIANCYGGAVYWNGANGNLFNCNFIDCYSHGSSSSSSTSKMTHRIHYMNNAYWTEDYSCSSSSSSTSNCYAGIYWKGSGGHLYNCSFINSTSSYTSGTDSDSDSGNYVSSSCSSRSSAYGGAVYWNGASGTVSGCNFIKSSSSSLSYKSSVYWDGSGNQFNCSFNGDYYNYEDYCSRSSGVSPLILIHTFRLDNDNRIVTFESTQLVNNISVKLYNVTDRIVLYDEFYISSEDLTSSLDLDNLEEGEYQIVLEYKGDKFYSSTSKNDFFSIGKNPSLEVIIGENLVEGDSATINLTLNNDATGKVKITLSNYTFINELINGKTSFCIPYLTGGINTYQIKYVGDSKYNPLYLNNTFNILYKPTLILNIKESNIFDETIPLTYSITQQCTGIISIYVDNIFKTNISVGELVGLENIPVGQHNITVIYNGDEYFSTCADSKILTVSKANSSIKINSSDLAGDVLFEVALNEKSTGNITIIFNSNPYSGRLKDGKTNIILPNLVAGNYNCTINYEGDSNYNSLTQNYNFELKLKKSNIILNVKDTNLGEIIDVNFNLTPDATGSISIYLNNSFIKNTSIGEKINISDLTVGNYLVKLVYNGDDYYEASENTTTFKVLKLKPTIDTISITSTSENITFGDIVDVNYHITDGVTGTVSIYIDSILNKKVNIGDSISLDGINAGQHTIKLVYNGDNNYQPCENISSFEVLKKKIDIPMNVKIIGMVYGKTQICFNTTFDGVLNINASNNYYKSFNINANINNYLNLSDIDAGDYDVEYVFVPNNQNYCSTKTTSTLTIFKAEPTFNIVINDVNYKESVNLNINYLNDITGFANITISNNNGFEIKYSNVALSSGKFNKVLSNLNASKYTVTLEYGGNNNYYSTTEYKTFNVLKIDPLMAVDVTNALYGQTAKIIVNCNVEGNITISIGSVKTYSELLIKDKRVSQNVNDFDAGTYDVTITYNGNDNYNIKTENTKLTIAKLSTNVVATVDDITYTETTVVNVKSSVDGVVTVKIDNAYINSTSVVANTITPVKFDNLPAGKHNVSVTLDPSNKNYNESSFNTDFTVSKKQTSITLRVKDSIYGEDVIVNVTASEDGKVILTVGDITREKNVFANTLTKINLGVLAASPYEVAVSFDAGNNYKPSYQNDNIVISQAKAEILTVQADNNVYGVNTIIKVKTNIDGNLTFNLGSTIKSFDIIANKLTSFDLGVLDADNYNVEISLDASNNYTKPVHNTQITISPKQTTVNVNVKDSIYGENVIVNVSASENGKITVKAGNIIKNVDVEANKLYPVDFGILNANSYPINVTFNAGNNYKESYNAASLVVSPAKSEIIEIQTQNYTYGENTVIKVKTNVDGVLNVTFNLENKKVNIVANQLTDINLGILDVNNYDVKLNFDAGNNYIPSQNKTFIIIKPKSTSVILSVKNYQYNENVIVNVTTTEKGKLAIRLGDIVRNIDMEANILTPIDFGILDSDSYVITVNFTAGNNYIDSNASELIKVLSKLDENNVTISVPEIKTNQDENDIIVKLPNDATGTVTLTICDKDYEFVVDNGVAIVKLPKLEEGDYDYVIAYSGDDNYSSYVNANSLSVSKPTPEIVIPSLNKPSNDGSVTIQLPNDAKGTITLTIANKPYYFPVTDGICKVYMPDLANGDYSYTITYSGDEQYSTFTKTGKLTINKPQQKTTPTKTVAKTTITLKKITVKKSAKKLILQATLKQGKKVLSGKKITFKFNGKKYTAKTNKKGIAKVTIKKAILKKLKVGKKIKYQSSYGKVIAKKTAKVKK